MNFKNGDSSPMKFESLQNLISSFARRIRGEYNILDGNSEAGSEDSNEEVFTNRSEDKHYERAISDQSGVVEKKKRSTKFCRSVDLSRRSDTGMYVSFNEDDRREDGVCCNQRHGLDILTGHAVLSFMEGHVRDSNKLNSEWEELKLYEVEPATMNHAVDPENIRKNRTLNVLPYDSNRFTLKSDFNVNFSDYINASTIIDHDPKSPTYIFTQGPLPHTVADFWQMMWESESSAIVNLSSITDQSECHPYWPEAGTEVYHKYEVHLVSQHISSADYVVRSLLLRNLAKNESRTITQYHYLNWKAGSLPVSVESLLEFRRKVNRFSRGKILVIHCSDGSGRTGTYALMDTVINRIINGTKELNISATLEHFRDQRMKTVETKKQYQAVLMGVVESVRCCLLQSCSVCNMRR